MEVPEGELRPSMEEEALARSIIRTLHTAGHEAWLVGGCVRDQLLGTEPGDFDVATNARPERILALFPGSGVVGAHFGVVLVRRGGACVEVATYRSDGAYADGRRPSAVRFETSAEADARRRDFTINGLFHNPDTGETLDFVGGRADLAARLIRAIGNPEERFAEDHLRMLRAVRFAARLGFEIEAETLAAIRKLHASILRIAPERIRVELLRILTEGSARRGFELLDDAGLLRVLLPEAHAMKGVEQPPEFHPEGDVWTHTLLVLEGLQNPSETLAMGALLHDVGKPATFRVAERIRFDGHAEKGVEIARRILERLRFSCDQTEQILALIGGHMKFMNVKRMKESTLKRFIRAPHFDELLELHRLDCMAGSRRLDNYCIIQETIQTNKPETLKPQPLVNGDDLIAAGYKPGPRFAQALRAAEDAQLEGAVSTREAALRVAIGAMEASPAPQVE